MASRILGIDLGAYSVKVVVANPGFRQAQIQHVVERVVPEGEEPHLVRAVRTLAEIYREIGAGDDAIFSAIAGDQVFLHVLEFAFKSLKRPDLERAVGAELEGQLPIDLEDMVYTFEQIPRAKANADAIDLGAPLEGEEPTFVQVGRPVQHGMVAPPTDGMRILAAATLRARAEEFLVALSEYRIEPRGLLATPAPYARLAERVLAAEGGSSDTPIAVLDVGHLRTDFCVVYGNRPVFARSIKRGGHHLTRAIERAWNLSYARAESAKHQEGMIGSAAEPPTSEAWRRIHDVLAKELLPLARDLRRTINSCRAKTGFSPGKIVLVGGGGRLRGMASFLTEQLHVPVQPLTIGASTLFGGVATPVAADTAALALGVALEGSSARPTFDLRQGSLAVRADLSFLRTKIPHLAAAALAVVAFGVVSAWSGLHKLRKAEEILDKRIALESAAEFGEQLSAGDLLAKVGPVEPGKVAGSPIPTMTAYDILLALNEALPAKDKATIEVEDVEIKAGKLTLKASSSPTGELSALDGIKNLEESLRSSSCFKEFESPESQPGQNDSRQFTLTIKTKCKE